VAIIAHGSSNARAIRSALRAAADQALSKQVNPAIVEMLGKVPLAAPAKGKGVRALFNRVRERLQRHNREADRGKRVPAYPSGEVIREPRSTGSLSRPDDDKFKTHPGEPSLADVTQQPFNGATGPQDRGPKPADEAAPVSDESLPPKSHPS
jgi:hypothetical protein